ncbi:MAG: carbon starvation protein A [Candidatus Electrothrix sp. AR3]|nr:carbon starvation protein A [Candidatus Electrothrix sp. AR3]
MNSLLLTGICFVGYLIAYHTYGKFLAKVIFKVEPKRVCPSSVLEDGRDYVPTKRSMLFGHHFTSIAGLGPIVGPAIAIIWGWVPAILWVFFGSILMGAVHDFGSLMVSLRNQGRSVGDLAAGLINHRVRTLFLLIIFFELLIVIAVFALIIGILFNLYPASVLPVWAEIPLAVYLGHLIYTKKANHNLWGLIAVIIMYLTILIGSWLPIQLPTLLGLNPVVLWVVIMLIYAAIASILPVTALLQPRDYINSHQLFVAIILLLIGVVVARPVFVAPAFNFEPQGAPPLFPFLFIIIACGAISGFHALVSSGTSAKQCQTEQDALFIGYGSMLTEAALSTLVIVAVGAAIGLGLPDNNGQMLFGTAAFSTHYASWAGAAGLAAKLKVFVIGSANLMASYGIPQAVALTIMGVFLVSFAATTLDSATRIQRYVVGELAQAYKLPRLAKPYPATLIVICSAALLAFHRGVGLAEVQHGALSLWPLFGTVNQLMAAMALLVVTVFLARRKTPSWVTAVPLLLMLFITGWAMLYNLNDFLNKANWLLFGIGIAVFLLEIWMVVETLLVLKKVLRPHA